MSSSCTFIVSAHSRPVHLKLCLLSLVLQTRTDWTAIVTDNANFSTYRDLNEDAVRWVGDDRISYLYTGNHSRNCYCSADYGAAQAVSEWLAFPSDDSYYVPWYFERLLRCASAADLLYCDMVLGGPHSHGLLDVHPSLCQIDKTGFLVRREWFERVGGFAGAGVGNNNVSIPGDGMLVEKLIAAGARAAKVREVLAVHN